MRNDRQEHGFSLVAALVAVAVTGIVAVGIATIMKNGNDAQQNVELKMERLAIARTLLARTSCAKTFEPDKTCKAPGELVDVLDAKERVVVAKTGTKFGGYTVRAECSPDKDGVLVKAVRLAAAGTVTSAAEKAFRKDPLTGNVVTWSDADAALMPSGTYLCPDGGGGGTTAWVPLACDGYYDLNLARNCLIKGNVSPEDWCKAKGFDHFTGGCKHDNVQAQGFMGHPQPFSGQGMASAFQSPVYGGNKWAISCATSHWQIPDFILCAK